MGRVNLGSAPSWSSAGALAEAVKIYHHNVRPDSFGTTHFLPFPRVGMEVMGVWSSGDPALTEAQMAESARYVQPGVSFRSGRCESVNESAVTKWWGDKGESKGSRRHSRAW